MKIKIGIIFGGFSKEREISFAGGRTVYDNLNKSLFEAVPVFVDSFGNFVLLNCQKLLISKKRIDLNFKYLIIMNFF